MYQDVTSNEILGVLSTLVAGSEAHKRKACFSMSTAVELELCGFVSSALFCGLNRRRNLAG